MEEKITLLTKEQVENLDVLRKYGRKAESTDFNKLLSIFDNYWTKTPTSSSNSNYVFFADSSGDVDCDYAFSPNGVRPVILLSEIDESELSNSQLIDGIEMIEYGEYPQTKVDDELEKKLEKLYQQNLLLETDKKYTYMYEYKKDRENYQEYFYENSKYVRIDSGYWVKVEPIKWLVDRQEGVAISEKMLTNMPFSYSDNNNYEESDIKEFLEKYFIKEIKPSKIYDVERKSENETSYGFDYRDVDEEEILKGSIEGNMPVFLHGLTGVGKTSRVKEIDPNYELVLMENATLDSLIGKTVYNQDTGEMKDVEPTWYSNICRKCKEEPDKIHVLFLDELTNALPSIQGKASTIISERKIESKWELPDNVRIVAAGNDAEESLSANELSVQLFSRFVHVYIQDDVDKWLNWASDADIHPAIYSYMAYKSYIGNSVLRTEYTGDKPNADPRRWEMASNILKLTKKPEMLRAYIGEELTRDFIEFSKIPVITVEDVINNNYDERDLEMNISKMFTTALGLSSVDEEHYEKVRDFMNKLSPEACAAFEVMWAHGDEERLLKVAEIQIKDNINKGGMGI